ncbi:TPA: PTS sugar transporter subunit IIB [Enterococcus faecalis]
MSKKTIMLVCSAGMSTSLLVTKMQKAAFNQGLDAHIFAASASEADTNLENNPVDVLLLGPQVRYMKSDFEKRLSPKGIPTDVISMSDYGLMNGEKVLEQALDLLAQADKKEQKQVVFSRIFEKATCLFL